MATSASRHHQRKEWPSTKERCVFMWPCGLTGNVQMVSVHVQVKEWAHADGMFAPPSVSSGLGDVESSAPHSTQPYSTNHHTQWLQLLQRTIWDKPLPRRRARTYQEQSLCLFKHVAGSQRENHANALRRTWSSVTAGLVHLAWLRFVQKCSLFSLPFNRWVFWMRRFLRPPSGRFKKSFLFNPWPFLRLNLVDSLWLHMQCSFRATETNQNESVILCVQCHWNLRTNDLLQPVYTLQYNTLKYSENQPCMNCVLCWICWPDL